MPRSSAHGAKKKRSGSIFDIEKGESMDSSSSVATQPLCPSTNSLIAVGSLILFAGLVFGAIIGVFIMYITPRCNALWKGVKQVSKTIHDPMPMVTARVGPDAENAFRPVPMQQPMPQPMPTAPPQPMYQQQYMPYQPPYMPPYY